MRKEEQGLEGTYNWLEAALPTISGHNASVQLGCVLEEVHELLEALQNANVPTIDPNLLSTLKTHANIFKKGQNQRVYEALENIWENEEARREVVDALADISVTTTSFGRQMYVHTPTALDIVNASNYSKFEDGKPVYDAYGKVAKGRHYVAPVLTLALLPIPDENKKREK